jgi:hypothetical protein
MADYNFGRNSKYTPLSNKIILFGKSPDKKFYVCYVMREKVVIFEWLQLTSAEIVDVVPVEFLIEKIMDGYKVVSVPKTRSGIEFMNNTVFQKYRRLLLGYYGNGIYLDENFRAFLLAVLYENQHLLQDAMRRINNSIELPF